jgi:nucleoid DNA-binding protein
VESLANTLNLPKSESERVLAAVVDVLKQALQRGEKIDLRGLGVFKVRESKPRQARNPRTGEALSIPARRPLSLSAGRNCLFF